MRVCYALSIVEGGESCNVMEHMSSVDYFDVFTVFIAPLSVNIFNKHKISTLWEIFHCSYSKPTPYKRVINTLVNSVDGLLCLS